MSDLINLRDLTLPELEIFATELNEPVSRAQQLFTRLYRPISPYGKAFMSESDGPEIGGINWFHQRVEQKMQGTVTPVFIDAWKLHMKDGEVHCGSNARRAPIEGVDWWEAWSE